MRHHHETPRILLIAAALACVATQASCDKLTDPTPVASASPTAEPATPPAAAPAAAAPAVAPAAVVASPSPPTPVVAAPQPAPPPKVDTTSLLDDKPTPTGVMAATDLNAIDASAAPRLGGDATPHPALEQATWQPLPGGRLAAANPPGWETKTNGNVESLISPDRKMGMLAITFESKDDMDHRLAQIGKAAKIKTVEWKDPKTVKLGPDSVTTILRDGEATAEDGTKHELMLALMETNVAAKLLVVVFADMNASKADIAQVKAMLTSVRRVAT